jgi:glycosyltransferase involved in cell wall biosynthesis
VGTSYTALSIYRGLRDQGYPVSFITPVIRKDAFGIGIRQAVPFCFRPLPWGYLRRLAGPFYKRAILNAARRGDIIDFWGDNPPSLLAAARQAGAVVVKEKFNCAQKIAREILVDEYQRLGLSYTGGITEESIRQEDAQLSLADFVFSPSPKVRESLMKIGVPPGKILDTSFGWWDQTRANAGQSLVPQYKSPRFLFVGTVEIRKGAHLLLEYWRKAAVPGTLIFLGRVKDEMLPIIRAAGSPENVVFLGHREKAHQIYDEVDAFIFPSLEDGGPLVTYEAMGHRLPVIVSPMGAGAVARNTLDGMVLDPFDAQAWTSAFRAFSLNSPELSSWASAARQRALAFTWDRVAVQRHSALMARLDSDLPVSEPN